MMRELLKAAEVMDKAYPFIREIDNDVILASFIGTMVDQWVADHDFSLEKAHKIVKTLSDIMEAVHDSEGMLPKTVERGN